MAGALVGCLAVLPMTASAENGTARLFAAGSLQAALSEVIQDYEAQHGVKVDATFGPSGLLKGRLEQGEAAEVFASANMDHPSALHESGLAGPVQPFARNQLCALAQPGLDLTSDTLLERMLDAAVRVATSTPKADPAGDYAWELFGKAEALKAGSTESLRAKALQLTGGPDSTKPPEGRNVYGWHMDQDRADIFLTYCTNARLAAQEVEGLQIVAVPEDLSVGAVYGLTVMNSGDRAQGEALAQYILSPDGQSVLERFGFSKP
ncbi:molybdate ABC transporter substrate-binding protein [Telmatospirillum sp. J64-1]|uniref:molybdate ABC transporter substrate-binding protein n=1 Tax=Telmatospirillum sp. J64-1 TaxID=2502183 RepID=UPI0021066871|nr:molybdate ABC transporter substrate-binding protein [Telmatospirillum sp. J64-1]